MKINFSFQVVLLLVLSILSMGSEISDDLVVEIPGQGKIRGFETSSFTGKKVSAWYGIPFAEPPLKDLRFKHPLPSKPWEGVKDTQKQPNSCMQLSDTTWPGFEGSEAWNANTNKSEDCLYLNVVVPNPHPEDAAVLLWIYGGGFWSGTTTLDLYDLRTIVAEENIIAVGIQYRVASLAFLYLDSEEAPGNAGMFDQVLALQWVKDNIEQFGGDPNKITIMGESAGAASVSLHLLSPLSRDLFSQGIMQSSSALAPWAVTTEQESLRRGMELAKFMDCPDDTINATIQCLREADAMDLLNAEWSGITKGFTGSIGIFLPMVDGYFLETAPETAMQEENFKKTNILLGSNKDEGFYFVLYYFPEMFPREEDVLINRTDFLKTISNAYPTLSEAQRKAIETQYTNLNNPNDLDFNTKAVDRHTGDYQFTCSVVDFAHRYAETDNDVYMYYFTQRASVSPWPRWTGSMHGDEIAFIFGQPLDSSYQYTDEEVQLSRQMMSYWANFAKTGNPSLPTGTQWPLHTPDQREILTLQTGSSEVIQGNRVEECAFWNNLLPNGETNTFDKCCSEKRVGGFEYRFIKEESTSGYECLNDCVYERVDSPGSKFCFKAGNQEVVCGDNLTCGDNPTKN